MARILTDFSLQHQQMSPKTLFREYFAKRYVAYEGRHFTTLTDTRIMSQFCLVQHVNLFPYSLARDSLGSQLMYIVYLDPFSIRKEVESSENIRVIQIRY